MNRVMNDWVKPLATGVFILAYTVFMLWFFEPKPAIVTAEPPKQTAIAEYKERTEAQRRYKEHLQKITIPKTQQEQDLAYIKHAVDVMIETRRECYFCHDNELHD